MKKNIVYNRDFLTNELADKSVQLIIADPPYFEVKGEFDFIWKSFEDYLKDVEKWAIECKRILADNGTLFWWGHAKKIAYAQIIFDKYFTLCNSLVWDKGCFMGLENSEGLRSFAPVTERVLMYGLFSLDSTGLKEIEKEYVAPRNPFAIELKKARLKKGVSINAVAEYGKFYGNVNHGGSVTNWERGYNIPNKQQWSILCNNLPIARKEYEDLRKEYEDLRKEYEDLRKEYEELRRPFDNIHKLTDVFKFSNDSAHNKHDHPTKKPLKLTRALIQTCSRKGDLVVVPFSGSGTECEAAIIEGRDVIAFDIEAKYCKMSQGRINNELNNPRLF